MRKTRVDCDSCPQTIWAEGSPNRKRERISEDGWHYVARFQDGHDLYPDFTTENKWLDLCPTCYEYYTLGIALVKTNEYADTD